MNLIAETDRLYLRDFTIDDAFHFYHMNNDKDVIKYTGDNAFKSIIEAKAFLKAYNQYHLYGMGRWAVCSKKNNEFLGWCGLKFHQKEKMVEVGYRFYKKHWNKGYATESSKASINYGFDTLRLKEIYAHAHIKNINSHRVIDKCNMTFINEAIYDNMPAKLYKIINPNYHIKKIKSNETYSVRHPILRVGRPLSDCAFIGDNNPSTLHLGLYFKKSIIGVATFLENSNPIFLDNNQYQLRGMATLEEFQNKGLGNLLLHEGERLLKTKTDLIWLNAREAAINFYLKNGYIIVGDSFKIKNIGLHYVMTKQLF